MVALEPAVELALHGGFVFHAAGEADLFAVRAVGACLFNGSAELAFARRFFNDPGDAFVVGMGHGAGLIGSLRMFIPFISLISKGIWARKKMGYLATARLVLV